MRADLRFFAELRDFLDRGHRAGTVTQPSMSRANVNDIIEAWCDRIYWQGSRHRRRAEIVRGARSVESAYQLAGPG